MAPPDEWMARLFGEDPPAAIFQNKAGALLEMMQPLLSRCLVLGTDVVLDSGFRRRRERDADRRLVRGAGAVPVLHRADCPASEAWRRVERRNLHLGRSLFIAPATFDPPMARIEPLEADEEHVAVR